MKTQNLVLKPQDIILLLKLVCNNIPSWNQKSVAESLGISQSEVSESVVRCKYAGLLEPNGKIVMKTSLMEFLQFGLRYVFPQRPGPVLRGVPTAHSANPLKAHIQSSEAYVWPFNKGTVRGQSILPLYPSVPEAALKDEKLYELLALVDAIRVGKARERELAIQELKKQLDIGE
jgi:hypothetical protein